MIEYCFATTTLGALVYPEPLFVNTISTIVPSTTITSALAPPPAWSTGTKCNIGALVYPDTGMFLSHVIVSTEPFEIVHDTANPIPFSSPL